MSLKDEIERIFAPWLTWSRDEEVVALLELVVAALRRRRYEITYQVTRPGSPRPEREGR